MESNTDIKKYSQVPIPGGTPKTILPKGTALVLEGGGTRGYYSSGVFEAFMDEGVLFPYIAGVSAGAANAISYVSGQRLRSRQVVQNYVADPRYVGLRNLLLHGSMFGFKFIFNDIGDKHVFIDWNNYNRQPIRFLTGAMDCETGKTVWFEKDEIDGRFAPTIASCSVPLISRIARYNGRRYLDGGISDPIPIDKSIADGNTFHVVILTRNAGYVKEPTGFRRLSHLMYRKYPRVAEAMENRHLLYARQVALCEELERQGRAVIIRPEKPLEVSRTGKDIEKLLALYDEGHAEGAEKLRVILGLV
jgi:predicted patatin/cPLA2 family phospholipase